MSIAVGCAPGCSPRQRSPASSYEHARTAFLQGELKQSQDDAHGEFLRLRESSPEWAWKFRILEANAALWRGLYEDVLEILQSSPDFSAQPELKIQTLTLTGVAQTYLHNFGNAQVALDEARAMCAASASTSCGDVLQAQGFFASEQNQSESAQHFYELSLAFARSHDDRFLEASSLLNLGAESLALGRLDEAIDRSEAADRAAAAIRARAIEFVAKGNVGWAYYMLGDREQALAVLLEAYGVATQQHDISNQENGLTNIGYIYMDERKFDLASQSFQQALELAIGIKAKQDIYNALRVLARLSLERGDLEQAEQYADRAIAIAMESHKRIDEFYPILVQGRIAAGRGNFAEAESAFREVELDKECPTFLKWEAQHSLATLYERSNKAAAADREYRVAIATFESARADVRHEDFHLSFLTNGWRIYDDYIHFLVAGGKTNDALRWADNSRARTLSEGLGLLKVGTAALPQPLKASEIARASRGTVLYYWLGEKQSYLWAITAERTKLFALPAADQIDAAVKRYRAALAGPQDVLVYGDPDGRWLYTTLVAPARALVPNDGAVYVIPDGTLNNLNFETLLVEGSSQLSAVSSQSDPRQPTGTKLHYWIEDATVTNAGSLLMLGAPHVARDQGSRRLLMLGNSISVDPRFPVLPHAASQMDAVGAHFPFANRQIFSGAKATAAAYLESHPEQYTNIHFVAHGTASRLSPLDSAIILSPSGSSRDVFKLYASEIIRHPLRADLVTISSCNGSGDRAYKGEGLVGLSWAFLRAGAHNVVAALWEVEDTSVERLMTRFYDELDRGKSPNAALRAAKLSLLQSETLRDPFYWAPFQLYTQGASVRPSKTSISTASRRGGGSL